MIKMFFGDHAPPHFHAEYGSHEALVEIATLSVIAGKLPARARGLVVEWAALHQPELVELWNRAVRLEPLGKIDPLP